VTAASYTARAMLEKLIGFDTTSRLSNLELIGFVEAYLDAHGIPYQRLENDEGTKANLLATVGPAVPGGVVLSGHSDVVPVDGQPWSSDPFQMVERDGKLYGRGTCDMKAFLAIGLALVPEMLAKPLTAPFHFAISFDEEVGCTGVLPMVKRIAEQVPPVRAVIVGEPTTMQIVNAHKGISAYRVAVRGREAHSSQPHRGANAIHAAGMVLNKIIQIAREKEEDPFPDSRFEPPYTSVHCGRFEGGTALNIIPLDAAFAWEYRLHPGDDGEAIEAAVARYIREEAEPWLQRFAPEASIAMEVTASVPGLMPEDDNPAEALVRHLTGQNASVAVSYGTEAGHFQSHSLSTVICGPGSIDQAHQPDEFIEIAQLEAGEAFMRKLIAWSQSGAVAL